MFEKRGILLLMERWVKAKSGKCHLDLGERSSQSMRVHADHVIVTSCRAHLDVATSEVVPENYHDRCSNCVRIELELRARRTLEQRQIA
jgi:hypothetical protein